MARLFLQLQKAIKAKYISESALDDYPLYHNHAPQNPDYPITIYNIVSAKTSLSMNPSGKPNNYLNTRVSFTVYVNENGEDEANTILEKIEELFNGTTLTLETGHFMCTNKDSENIGFYNSQEKVYGYNQDYIIKIGD